MTKKTGDVTISQEVNSIDPKLSAKVRITSTAASTDLPLEKKQPALLYAQNMLSTGLRTNIDKCWEACWPINSLRPLVLLDLVSYLLFIKKLEEKQLFSAHIQTSGDHHTKGFDELSWTGFRDLDAQSMHLLFTKENGIPDLMKNYGNAGLMYSLFVKEPLILTPTARLLTNMVNIIKIMEAEDAATGAAIFEYLLNKTGVVALNGQVYAPAYAVTLMVALMEPSAEDIIGDPSVGNGSFLVNSAKYIVQRNTSAFKNVKDEVVANIYKGIECDLIQIRIGAMNMILHGIEDPKLEGLNVFSRTNLTLHEQPSLVLSNLFFESVEDKPAANGTVPLENRRPDLRFLNLILKNLRSGGRSAVIVRENILYDNGADIKSIRQQLIDEHKLEAIISLPGAANSLFSNANILIFSKPEAGTTDKVWFCRMETKKGINIKDATESVEQYDNVPEILARWKNEKEETGRSRTDKSFYVPVKEIKNNNYNLSFNEYGRSSRTQLNPHTDTGIKEEMDALEEAEPRTAKRFSKALASITFICVVALAVYFGFFKTKNEVVSPATTGSTTPPVKIKQEKQPLQQQPSQPVKNSPATAMLSQAQIKAILSDTTGILHFQDPVGNASTAAKTPKNTVPKFKNVAVLVDKTTEKPQEPQPEETPAPVNLKVQYMVRDTTYFHDKPEESTRRKSFLDPLNKNILTPIDDQNGFIYIVYTNHSGITSKGWINKKDLRPLQ